MTQPPLMALIDCDNFFASCERIFRPDTWGKPVIVLSNNDGCVVARSKEARDLGIAMGVPLFKIKPLVKAEKVFVFSANFGLYGDISQRLTDLLKQVTPRIETYSIDESFVELAQLGITDYQAWANQLRQQILTEIGIPVSIGIAPNKTLAKAASEYAKKQTKDHIWVVSDESNRVALLDWLPLQGIWGIGWRLGPKLREYGISTPAQLVKMPEAWLRGQLSIKGLNTVKELKGESIIAFEPKGVVRKTIMYSRMFGHHVRDGYQLESAIASYTASAVAKLRSQGSVAGAITVFLVPRRGSEAKTAVALRYLNEPSAHTGTFIKVAVEALDAIIEPELAYQKAGVIVTNIRSVKEWQLSLLTPDTKRTQKQRLMQAVDDLKHRFGPGALIHATEQLTRDKSWHSQHGSRSPAYTTNWQELPQLNT